MNWPHTVRAKARAAMAERKTPVSEIFASTSSSWNRNDAWLTRETRTRDRATEPSVRDPATPSRHGPAIRD